MQEGPVVPVKDQPEHGDLMQTATCGHHFFRDLVRDGRADPLIRQNVPGFVHPGDDLPFHLTGWLAVSEAQIPAEVVIGSHVALYHVLQIPPGFLQRDPVLF
jgi:hypothetical protein